MFEVNEFHIIGPSQENLLATDFILELSAASCCLWDKRFYEMKHMAVTHRASCLLAHFIEP